MSRLQSPPTLNAFPDVFADAVGRLERKVAGEDAQLADYEENNRQINARLDALAMERGLDEKQFVFRVIEISGLNCSDPIFDLKTDSNEHATVYFRNFTEGDVIINLAPTNATIDVAVVNNDTEQLVYSFQVRLADFADKRRREREEGNDQLAVFYEGQLIFNRVDYNRGLLHMNAEKVDELRQNRNEYANMKEQLLRLFPEGERNSLLNSQRNSLTQQQQQAYNINNSQYSNRGGPEAAPLNLRGSMVRSISNPNVGLAKQSALSLGLFGDYVADGNSRVFNAPPSELGRFAAGSSETPGRLNWHPFVQFLLFATAALLFASLLVNWHRASFLSLTMGAVYATWFFLKDDFDQLLHPVFLGAGFGLALLFDLLWLILYASDAWNRAALPRAGQLSGLDKLGVVASCLLVVCEAACVGICGVLQMKGMTANPADRMKKSALQLRI